MVTTVTRYQFNRTYWGCGAELTEGVIIKVEGFEGRNVSFQCSHTLAWKNHKYFCKDPCTNKHNRWETKGRFSMYDNTTGSFFIVKVDKLRLNDSGTYQCGVDISLQPDYHSAIKLNVSQEFSMHFPRGGLKYTLNRPPISCRANT
uniref:Immunoglobulin domain-containing protein n=1 Tax=Neolamprologus brichardi TaxID=32507 RepID=A0A3Q4G6B9_NEOBR